MIKACFSHSRFTYSSLGCFFLLLTTLSEGKPPPIRYWRIWQQYSGSPGQMFINNVSHQFLRTGSQFTPKNFTTALNNPLPQAHAQPSSIINPPNNNTHPGRTLAGEARRSLLHRTPLSWTYSRALSSRKEHPKREIKWISAIGSAILAASEHIANGIHSRWTEPSKPDTPDTSDPMLKIHPDAFRAMQTEFAELRLRSQTEKCFESTFESRTEFPLNGCWIEEGAGMEGDKHRRVTIRGDESTGCYIVATEDITPSTFSTHAGFSIAKPFSRQNSWEDKPGAIISIDMKPKPEFPYTTKGSAMSLQGLLDGVTMTLDPLSPRIHINYRDESYAMYPDTSGKPISRLLQPSPHDMFKTAAYIINKYEKTCPEAIKIFKKKMDEYPPFSYGR